MRLSRTVLLSRSRTCAAEPLLVALHRRRWTWTHRLQFSCNFSAFPVGPQPHQRVRGGALIARSDTRRARVTAPLPLSQTFARRRHHRRGAPSTRYYTLFARAPRTVFDAPRRGVGIGIFPPPSFRRPPTSRCRSGTVPTELLSMPTLAWSAWT